MPARTGVAKLVPLEMQKPDSLESTMSLPRATTSGLMRPSAVGPGELKGDRVLSSRTAPTVRTEATSAGELRRGRGSRPLLPAALRRSMPLETAMAAAMAMGVVWPSSCWGV